MLRRFSRRSSRGGKKESEPSSSKEMVKRAPVELMDTPVPATRTLTTANLFQPVQATSTQTTNMDRTLYEIPQPAQVDAMSDLIKDHPAGEFFPYVGVVGSEGEHPDARRARMLALKPSYNKRDIPEVQVLGCPLISREGDFTMETLMSFAKVNSEPIPDRAFPMPRGAHQPVFTISKPYVHIRQVTILFTPNVSSTSNYCKLWMNLVDNRLIDTGKGSQSNVIVSNQEGILEMSCDYCISAKDLGSFTLSYTLERDIVHPSFQWGTASFYFSITESDLPYQSSKVDAMAVYRMPITTLIERKTNADKSDISFTPADIVKLRSLYANGDIVDVDEPQRARLKTSMYSKSMRAQPRGEKIDVQNKPGWEFMQGATKHKLDAHLASVEPEEEEDVAITEIDLDAVSRQRKTALERYKMQQEESRKDFVEQISIAHSVKSEPHLALEDPPQEIVEDEVNTFFRKDKPKKQVRIDVSGV